MWEDGLNHYLNLHHNKLFYLKGLMKLILGHYSKGVFDPDYKRYKLNIRDRFVNKNLVYKPTVFTDVKDVHGVIFIAQPVVDDGIITIDKYISGLCRLAKHYESYPFYYLTHPREKNKVIDTLVSNGFKVIEVNESAECYLMRNRYTINISMFSTVICNIFEYRNCKYVPEFFYLEKLNSLIKNSVFNKKD
ncbi:glycosyltransferase family 52 [Pseudoalteromonas sp. H100]|nr:glycosyltransferase family 52 [Pseudoalteromonas sp. H100]WFO20513.1 glycosyltransferase family 52 [Pseudoalteromonas sp. H100]